MATAEAQVKLVKEIMANPDTATIMAQRIGGAMPPPQAPVPMAQVEAVGERVSVTFVCDPETAPHWHDTILVTITPKVQLASPLGIIDADGVAAS